MKYEYIVQDGNGDVIMKDALKRRSSWKSVDVSDLPKSMPEWKKLSIKLQQNKFNFVWKPSVRIDKSRTIYDLNSEYIVKYNQKKQLINHFRFSDVITNKNNLIQTLGLYSLLFDISVFDTIPISFSSNSLKNIEINSDLSEDGTIWIVKPENEYGGKDIEIFNKYNDVVEFLSIKKDEWIVQKYINNPLLINGRKFDVRVHALVTEKYDVYIYLDGIVRTSSYKYEAISLNSLNYHPINSDKFKAIHVTNNKVQKTTPDFEKYEEGNSLSFEQLQEYFDLTNGKDNVNFRRDILPRMSEIILDCISSARDLLMKGDESAKPFEIFGFDFIIDENFRTWLLEVNMNPGFDYGNKWADNLMFRMCEEMLELTLDKQFKSQKIIPLNKKYYNPPPTKLDWKDDIKDTYVHVKQKITPNELFDYNSDSNSKENRWELIYSEHISPLKIKHQKNMRNKSLNKDIIDEISILEENKVKLSEEDYINLCTKYTFPYVNNLSKEEIELFVGKRSMGPFLKRYIHIRNDEWYYPYKF